MPETEAAELAADFAMDDETIEGIKGAMGEWAERDNLPEVHPGGKIAMLWANWEIHNLFASRRLNERIDRIEAEQQRQRKERAKEKAADETIERVRDIAEGAARPDDKQALLERERRL